MEEQRSELPRTSATLDMENGEPNLRPAAGRGGSNTGATVPDEDFFSLILRVQGGRMDDQRAAVSVDDYQSGFCKQNMNNISN